MSKELIFYDEHERGELIVKMPLDQLRNKQGSLISNHEFNFRKLIVLNTHVCRF